MIEQLTDDEIRLTKWFDGELRNDEISDLLAKYPDLHKQRAEMNELGGLVRLSGNSDFEPCEPPFPELFNRQVLRRIQETPATQLSAWLEMARDWFSGSQWAVPATAMVALTAILVSGTRFGSDGVGHSEVVHTFAPHPEHSASSEYLPLAASTVIRLEGLEAIEPTDSITGYFRTDRRDGHSLASTVVYPQAGRPVAVHENSTKVQPGIQLASSPAR
jgi:hypothetical protein